MSVVRFAAGAAFTLAAAGAVLVVGAVRGASRAWALLGRRWARALMRICGLEIRVAGQGNVIAPAIFVANHQSFLDPMLLTAVLPARTKWVAKAEFRRVPILGRAFGACAIYVDRRDSSSAREALGGGLKARLGAWSLGVFPEGTRTGDGQLQAFKKGVFHLSLQLGLPIVPLGVVADPLTLPREAGLIRPGSVRIDVGRPIPTDGWKLDEADRRVAEIREAVSDCLARAHAVSEER